MADVAASNSVRERAGHIVRYSEQTSISLRPVLDKPN